MPNASTLSVAYWSIRGVYVVLLACIGLAAMPGSSAMAQRMPPGSFLRHPVSSVTELRHEVEVDPVAAARYARLFGMSPQMVRLAFAQMHRIRLSQDHVFKVHFVRPDGQIGYKLRRVKKGTWVYATPDGTPALIEICGNALVKSVLRIPPPQLSQVPAFSPVEALPPTTTPAGSPTLRGLTPVQAALTAPPGGFVPVETPELAYTPTPALALPALKAAAISQVSHFANGGLVLVPLGLIPLLFTGGGGGSSATQPIVIPPPIITGPIPGVPQVPVVPEPGFVTTFLAFLAVAGLYTFRLRKRGKN